MLDCNEIRLIWHRRDLRLHDNPLYSSDNEQHRTKSLILSVYIFDTAFFRPRPSISISCDAWNTVDVGPHAARVLLETISDLRKNLRSKGSELLIRYGDPLEILPKLAAAIGAKEVCWSEEPGVYEARLSRKLQLKLKDQVLVSTYCTYTLYHPDDLPRGSNEWTQLAHPKQKRSKKPGMGKPPQGTQKHNNNTEGPTVVVKPVQVHSVVDVSTERFNGAPKVMGDFRRACRTFKPLRPSLPSPSTLEKPDIPEHIEIGDLPSLYDLVRPLLDSKIPILGMRQDIIHEIVASAQRLSESTDPWISRGGESQAIHRLDHFVNHGHAKSADRSLAEVQGNGSSKLSVHLAMGSISPRLITEMAKKAGDDCSWLISHLEMRDFFLYSAIIYGHRLFHIDGMPVNKKAAGCLQWNSPTSNPCIKDHWQRWALGHTGLPLIDAAMSELRATGYCSNRVRQNAASVLTKDLGIDWRAGAEWYQLLLEDHCVGANWGNWMYFAGVGSDPKHRHFRTVSQARRYDPHGSYVSKWIPRLALEADIEVKLRPWNFLDDWGDVIVDPMTQYTWHDLQKLDGDKAI